jgi:hypothetical protein
MVPESPQSPTPSLPISELAGKVAAVCDPQGRNFVLVPISEEVLEELCTCENANDDLGIGLLLSAEKLLLVDCGTEVKILDAQSPDRGCAVRIMAGQFYGTKAFIRRINLDIVL